MCGTGFDLKHQVGYKKVLIITANFFYKTKSENICFKFNFCLHRIVKPQKVVILSHVIIIYITLW